LCCCLCCTAQAGCRCGCVGCLPCCCFGCGGDDGCSAPGWGMLLHCGHCAVVSAFPRVPAADITDCEAAHDSAGLVSCG
ncbi:hypothetical protein C9890_0260, partial [Perkinsus sp. BL_2016]